MGFSVEVRTEDYLKVFSDVNKVGMASTKQEYLLGIDEAYQGAKWVWLTRSELFGLREFLNTILENDEAQ